MRLIGHLADESTAKTFADYLYVQGIQNQLEHEMTDGWGIWISDEDQLDHASGLLVAYRQNPDDPKYQAGGKTAGKLRAKEEDDKEAYHKKIRNRRDLFRPLTGYGFGPLTFALIVCSIIVFAVSSFGDKPEPIMSLFITDFGSSFDNTLPELRQGQLWRIFTPIFIHFGPLHIICNMLWLRDLGS